MQHGRPTIKLYPTDVREGGYVLYVCVYVLCLAATATALLPTAQFSYARAAAAARLRENYDQDSNEGDTTLYRAVRVHL